MGALEEAKGKPPGASPEAMTSATRGRLSSVRLMNRRKPRTPAPKPRSTRKRQRATKVSRLSARAPDLLVEIGAHCRA